MQLTRAADYAVRVMVHLAGLPPGTRTNRSNLAVAAEVPHQFMGKILQSLCRVGLLHSHRGAAGGFTLLTPPAETTLLQVVEAIEGPVQLNLCLAPGAHCDRLPRCAAHGVWVEAQAALVKALSGVTLARLAGDAERLARGQGSR